MKLKFFISFIAKLNQMCATKQLSFSHVYSEEIEQFLIMLKRNNLIQGYLVNLNMNKTCPQYYVTVHLRYGFHSNLALMRKVSLRSGLVLKHPFSSLEIHLYHQKTHNFQNPLIIVQVGSAFFTSVEAIEARQAGRFWGFIYL